MGRGSPIGYGDPFVTLLLGEHIFPIIRLYLKDIIIAHVLLSKYQPVARFDRSTFITGTYLDIKFAKRRTHIEGGFGQVGFFDEDAIFTSKITYLPTLSARDRPAAIGVVKVVLIDGKRRRRRRWRRDPNRLVKSTQVEQITLKNLPGIFGDQPLVVPGWDMPLHQNLANQQVIGPHPQHHPFPLPVTRHGSRNAVDGQTV